MQSQESMFTNGPILDQCGWYGEEEGMESILRGVIKADEMEKDYPQFGREGVEFIKALRYVKDDKGKKNRTI